MAVDRMYRMYLGRSMDPAGFTWVDRIAQGLMSFEQVKAAILNSPEYLAKK
jgi:hypothetical protein